ncbi:helix-turn-helix domain-containing protein [Salinibacter sp.]|jgi:transcriptional regulator with XRE-family HTH domain|uniref:helix-turn-helix domain-containing protein n=1 Tax=Salinibacter sp. TaxID=2065818 RepID=UPI001ABA823C|nr:helix-turn-helix domain-containing protein [Salinibacter sp.]
MPDESTVRVADWLADDWRDLQHDPTFIAEELILDVAVQIAEAMEEAGFETQEELANELDVSESAVSQLLSGDQNISLKRLVTVALALGKSVEVDLVDRDRPDVEAVPTKTKRLAVDGGTTQRSNEQMAAWADRAEPAAQPDTAAKVNVWTVLAGDSDDRPVT